jgi:hypothetical protein
MNPVRRKLWLAFRLDNLDTYSNLLYVKEQRVELSQLAHKSVEIDKYRTETCCVVGNYYSLRFKLGTFALTLWVLALAAWYSGHRIRLQNRRSRVRIPPGCKVF